MKIRDGILPHDKLLFSSFDSGHAVEVVTSGPVVMVEFMTSPMTPASGPALYRDFPVKASLPIHINGFIISYRSSAVPTTTAGPLLYQYKEKPAMHSGVTIAGIAICAVAIVAAVAFVVVQRFTVKGRRAKYAMAASTSMDSPAQREGEGRIGEVESKESPAHRTVSSAQSSSPSSQGNTINVDMEVPLTGKLKRKAGSSENADHEGKQNSEKSIKELDRPGHHKKKKKRKLMVRIDMNPVAHQPSESGTSQSMSTKTTVNVGTSSPRRLELIDTDEIENVEGGSSSAPQGNHSISPSSSKHRHHHHRHHRRHREGTEAPPTKFDLLRKLRQASGELDAAEGEDKNKLSSSSKSAGGIPSDFERDVTGSSGSRSPVSVATTKAEVNWPKATGGDGRGVGGAANFVRAALHDVVGRTFASSSSTSDRYKRSAAAGLGYHQHPQRRPPSEEIPLMDSMTSSLDSPSHFNALVKSESQDSATTSFVNRGDGLPPARRPTSLTASYNSTLSNDSNSPVQELQQKPKLSNRSAIMENVSGLPRPTKASASALTPSSSSIPPPPSASEIKSLSHPESVKRTLPLLRPYPQPSSSSKGLTKSQQSIPERAEPEITTLQTPTPTQLHYEERTLSLPRPDGQSPRPNKRESPGPSSPCSKTLTRGTNPLSTSASAMDSGPVKKNGLTPISINTSGINNVPKTNQAANVPEAASSPRNLAIPAHLQGKKSPGSREDIAQAQNSPSRLSGKSTPTSQGLPSPGKLSKGSSKASRGNLSNSLASPSRSLHSEVEGLELEYDDFIEDDPLSYFDYEETMKLTFRGKEKIGKSPVEEEDEEDDEVGEQTKIKL